MGKASKKFVGIDLAEVDAAGLLPRPPCSANAKATPETADIERSCSTPDARGLVCLNGKASLGDIAQAMVKLDSHLLIPSPHAAARISLHRVGDIDIAASSSITKLAATILGFDVAVYLPSLEHVSASTVIDLLSSLLRPSIDLEALLSGKIVISPSHGHDHNGNGDGGGGDGGGGGRGGGGGGGGTPPPGGNGPYQGGTSQILSSAPGKYTLGAEDIPGWPDAQRLVIGLGGKPVPYYYGPVYFRRADAAQFTARKLFPVPGATVGELPDHRPFILACNTLPCGSGDVSMVPLLKPPNEPSFGQPTEPLPKLAGSPIPLVVNGIDRTPSLANYLAVRLHGASDMPALYCIAQLEDGKCWAVLTGNDPTHWLVLGYNETPVDADSLIGTIARHCMPACGSATIAAISAAFHSRTLGFYEDPGKGLAVVATVNGWWLPPGADQALVYRQYDPNLEHVIESKIMLKGARNPGTVSTATVPQGIWQAVAHKLLAEQYSPNRWVMMTTHRPTGGFFALVGEKEPSAVSVVISGVVRTDGSACVRSRTYTHLLGELDSNWTENSSGERAGGISRSALEAIHNSTDGAIVLQALSDPRVSDGTYPLSPILWMGNPDKPENCRWDSAND